MMGAIIFSFLSLATAVPLLQGLDDKLASKYPTETASSLRASLANALSDALAVEQVPPSFAACSRDVSGCPRGFSDLGASSCAAPAHYAGECSSPINFGGLSPKEKIILAESCGVAFPCSDQQCDYSQSCPSGWTTSGDYCVAPKSYNGPCVSTTKFSHLSDEGKDAWATKCGVSFCK